jgi:predicted alpha-1,2-mannosidase
VGSQTATTSLAAPDPVSLVDPFIGTEGNGHTFPGADVPFGMVQFSPVSVGGGPGGYEFDDTRLRGFSLTRLSGAGCANYGDVPLMPTAGPPRSSPVGDPWAFTSGFSHTGEVAQPGYYQVGLRSGISVALTATTRTGLGVFTYPASASHGTLLIDPSASADHESASIQVVGSARVVGSATSAAFGGGCGHPPGRYTVYFALAFARPFTHFGVWSGSGIAPGRRQLTGAHAGAYVSFDTGHGRAVPVRAAISYVSVANALGNLAADQPSWSLGEVRARARARWDQLLGRIRVSGGSQAQEEVFYTALYHALLFPSVFSDANGEYLGEDGRVHTAAGYTQYTNFSEWDIYRGEIQLLALLAPRQASDIIRSLVADGRQTGQLPRWLVANTETGLMVGDPADAIIGDAFAFGARRFNATLALREMLAGAGAGAGSPSPRRTRTSATAARRYEERPALGSYLSRGYIPVAPSTTLEYSIADFAISQLARALGDTGVEKRLLARSGNWRQTFDPRTGFVEPRLGTGAFPRSVRPTSTAGFVEGNGWQYTFMVPQDMRDLLAAIGSRTAGRERLDGFFSELNAGPAAPHAWLGNEPSFLAPYAYLWLGVPARSAAVVHRALTNLFAPLPGGLPGNDDLGAISAWYVWSALGLYPAIPAVPGLALISPLFPSATIRLPNGSRLQINAPRATDADLYVRSLDLNDGRYGASWLPLARIARGGRLDFVLGTVPSHWATGQADLPPSFAAGTGARAVARRSPRSTAGRSGSVARPSRG